MATPVSTAEETERIAKLAAFISFLKKELGCELKIHERFEDRLKLQKYVYLADHYGLNSGYDFSMYIHGPYSPKLAEDYYKQLDVETALPPEFRSQDFIKLVAGKDADWLEIAATIVSIYEYNQEKGVSRSDITKIVSEIKPWAAKDYINKVIDELIKAKLISPTPTLADFVEI